MVPSAGDLTTKKHLLLTSMDPRCLCTHPLCWHKVITDFSYKGLLTTVNTKQKCRRKRFSTNFTKCWRFDNKKHLPQTSTYPIDIFALTLCDGIMSVLKMVSSICSQSWSISVLVLPCS